MPALVGIREKVFSYAVFSENVFKLCIISMYSFGMQKKMLRTWREVMIVKGTWG